MERLKPNGTVLSIQEKDIPQNQDNLILDTPDSLNLDNLDLWWDLSVGHLDDPVLPHKDDMLRNSEVILIDTTTDVSDDPNKFDYTVGHLDYPPHK